MIGNMGLGNENVFINEMMWYLLRLYYEVI